MRLVNNTVVEKGIEVFMIYDEECGAPYITIVVDSSYNVINRTRIVIKTYYDKEGTICIELDSKNTKDIEEIEAMVNRYNKFLVSKVGIIKA